MRLLQKYNNSYDYTVLLTYSNYLDSRRGAALYISRGICASGITNYDTVNKMLGK